jgi:hypothetical protein
MSGKVFFSRLLCNNDAMLTADWKSLGADLVGIIGTGGVLCSLSSGAYYGGRTWLIAVPCTIVSIIAMVAGAYLSRKFLESKVEADDPARPTHPSQSN